MLLGSVILIPSRYACRYFSQMIESSRLRTTSYQVLYLSNKYTSESSKSDMKGYWSKRQISL